MRILRNIIITLLLLALAAISVVGLMVELPQILGWTPKRINQLGQSFIDVMRPNRGMLWLWLGLAVGCLLVLVMTVFKRRKPMRIEVQMGGGRVIILDSAIKRYIRTALSELSDVTVKRIDLKETRSGISTEIHADVKTQENLPVLERRMIQRVRAALAEDLGITSISDVHVFIRDFDVTGRTPGVRRETSAGDTDTESFRGPTPTTGPFDQVPMPSQAATLPKKDDTFFTPKPKSQPPLLEASPAADILPASVLADEAAAPVVEALPAPASDLPASALPSDEAKPKRRGLFGLGRASEESTDSEPLVHEISNVLATGDQELTYNPATSAEGLTSDAVPPTEIEAASLGEGISMPVDTPPADQENRN